MLDQLWGEIGSGTSDVDGDEPRNTTGLGKAERDELCKLPQIPLLEGPKLYQPQLQVNKMNQEYQTDVTVENNIRLVEYKRCLMQVLDSLAQQKAASATTEGGTGQTEKDSLNQIIQPPPFPQLTPSTKISKSNYMKMPPADEIKPTESSSPQISRSECLRLLRRSVIKLSAHAGYTNANNSALHLLTEIAENYILNISRKLRHELDKNLMTKGDGDGWSDILEKVLVESGSGGMIQLQDYHENYVVKYNSRLLSQCRELEEKYKKEMNSCLESGQDNIPEMHFPSSHEGAGDSLKWVDYTPTLDVGMQMLQSLEASVDLGEEPPLSNQSDMALSNQSCATPSPALTPRNASCPTPSPAFNQRPLHAPSPQLGASSAKKRRRSGGKFI